MTTSYSAIDQYRKGRKAYQEGKKQSNRAGLFWRLGYRDAMFDGAVKP